MNQFKTTILLLLFPMLSFAQYDVKKVLDLIRTGSEQELVVESSQMMQEGYYYQAGLVTDRLLELQPQSSNYNYRRAFIYLEMSNDFIHATPMLEIAVQALNENWDAYSSNEKKAPLDALYHMGRAYHMGGNIAKAEEFYNRFLTESSSKSEFEIGRAHV